METRRGAIEGRVKSGEIITLINLEVIMVKRD